MSKARSPRADCSRTVGMTDWRTFTAGSSLRGHPAGASYLIGDILYSS